MGRPGTAVSLERSVDTMGIASLAKGAFAQNFKCRSGFGESKTSSAPSGEVA